MRGMSVFQKVVVGLVALIAVVVAGVFLLGGSGSADGPAPISTARGDSPGTVAEQDLPVQAQQTIARIQRGGPYLYSRDGIVFENREGRLPSEPAGFYHEFTVPTPGTNARGAWRMVSGSNGFYYYTTDHYGSFRQVVLDES